MANTDCWRRRMRRTADILSGRGTSSYGRHGSGFLGMPRPAPIEMLLGVYDLQTGSGGRHRPARPGRIVTACRSVSCMWRRPGRHSRRGHPGDRVGGRPRGCFRSPSALVTRARPERDPPGSRRVPGVERALYFEARERARQRAPAGGRVTTSGGGERLLFVSRASRSSATARGRPGAAGPRRRSTSRRASPGVRRDGRAGGRRRPGGRGGRRRAPRASART